MTGFKFSSSWRFHLELLGQFYTISCPESLPSAIYLDWVHRFLINCPPQRTHYTTWPTSARNVCVGSLAIIVRNIPLPDAWSSLSTLYPLSWITMSSETKYYHHGRFRVAGGVLPDAITAYQTYGSPENPCVVFPTCYGAKMGLGSALSIFWRILLPE